MSIGETRKESKTVELGSAQSVRVELNMKAGELRVAGGSPQLLDADFTYNVPEWKPEVKYAVSGSVGNLEVNQGGSSTSGGDTRNEWDLHLSNKTPMEMEVNMGAGRATLTLSGMALNRLELNMGAGETTVDLTGDWKKNLSAEINGGVGKATIRLPKDATCTWSRMAGWGRSTPATSRSRAMPTSTTRTANRPSPSDSRSRVGWARSTWSWAESHPRLERWPCAARLTYRRDCLSRCNRTGCRMTGWS